MPPIITLTTDFGRDSAYAAAMKGVMLSINPAVVIVDITHGIRPQNVVEGAIVLADAARWFPVGTVHVAVVDPGVGTSRRIVYLEVADQAYLGPDNGLFSYVCRDLRPTRALAVTNRSLFLPKVSNTFHGRDIMAPVAARLSLGLPPEQLGPPVDDLMLRAWPTPQATSEQILGEVILADSFGNLMSNVRATDLPGGVSPAAFRIHSQGHDFVGIVNTYLDAPSGTPVALVGSSGLVELAVVQGNAATTLKIPVGAKVIVNWVPGVAAGSISS